MNITPDELSKLIRFTVAETVKELKRHGFQQNDRAACAKIGSQLKLYYSGKLGTDTKIYSELTGALRDVQGEAYFKIIPYFYKDGYKLDKIAMLMNMDSATVWRNKKRICMRIYNLIEWE